MRILILFLLATSLLKSSEELDYVMLDYVMLDSVNNKKILYNQESLKHAVFFFHPEIIPPEILNQFLNDLIVYGQKQGFNPKTVLGYYKFKLEERKDMPSLEKKSEIFKPIVKIKLDPKVFQLQTDTKLEIRIQDNSEGKSGMLIKMSPAMKTLLKEMRQKNQAVQ